MAEQSDQTESDQGGENPFRGAAAYQKMVGSPDPSRRVDDTAKAEAEAYGTRHLMDAAVNIDRDDMRANQRHDANVLRLKADRLANGIGEDYDKSQAGLTESPDAEPDKARAENMAYAASKKMDKASIVQASADHGASIRSENQTLTAEGAPELSLPVGQPTAAGIEAKNEHAERLRKEADQDAEVAGKKFDDRKQRRTILNRFLGRGN